MRFAVLCLFLVFSIGCSLEKYDPNSQYDFSYLINNVRVKHKNEYSITYEYKNVRIDEIAFMASEYCHDYGEKRAVLQSSQLYKNFSRRATFNCI